MMSAYRKGYQFIENAINEVGKNLGVYSYYLKNK